MKLEDLFITCLDRGEVPQDLRETLSMSIYKNKGDTSNYSNNHGNTLFSITGKILTSLRSNRGTIEMIILLRQIQEKCREQIKSCYVAFINLTKAFNMVSCDGLWKTLSHLGCPLKLLTIIHQLHENEMHQVKYNSMLSYLKWHQARLHPHTDPVLYFLQHVTW